MLHLDCEHSHLRFWPPRHVRDRYDLFFAFAQRPAAVRAAPYRYWYSDPFLHGRIGWFGASQKWPFARSASWPLWSWLAETLRERRCRSPSLQPLNLRSQLLDQASLFKDDLDQFFTTERINTFHTIECTNSARDAIPFKNSDPTHTRIPSPSTDTNPVRDR